MTKAYDAYKEKVKEKQADMSKEEVMERLEKKAEYTVDLDNLKPVEHNWVDRGMVMSCEGAGHPNHRSFKFKR